MRPPENDLGTEQPHSHLSISVLTHNSVRVAQQLKDPSVGCFPTLSHVYVSQQAAHLLWCLYFHLFFLSKPPPNTVPPPCSCPPVGCGSGEMGKKKNFHVIGFDNTERSRTEGSPIAKCNHRVESIILRTMRRKGSGERCRFLKKWRRVWRGVRTRGGRWAVAPHRGPRGWGAFRAISPSILISSDLPLPCFTAILPTVSESDQRHGGTREQPLRPVFTLQLFWRPACLPVCLTANLTERCISVLVKRFPIHPACHTCLSIHAVFLTCYSY